MAQRTGTRRRGPSKARPRPSAEVEPSTPSPNGESAEPEIEWATGDMLGGDVDYTDVVLPVMMRKVRVRFLDTAETARVQGLPDYAGFTELARRLASGEIEESDLETETSLATDTVRYQAHIAHLVIIDPRARGAREALCADCDFKHGPTLWSLRQTRRMATPDLDFVTAVAFRAQGVLDLRPFSSENTQVDSPEPADTSG